jgi:hypothetical protein
MVVSGTNGGGRYNFSNIPTRYHTMAPNGAYVKKNICLSYWEMLRVKGE